MLEYECVTNLFCIFLRKFLFDNKKDEIKRQEIVVGMGDLRGSAHGVLLFLFFATSISIFRTWQLLQPTLSNYSQPLNFFFLRSFSLQKKDLVRS